MTQHNKGRETNLFTLKSKRKCCHDEKTKIEIMIQGYKEMAEINLTISKLCFEVESEADGLYIRPTECE